MAAAGTDAMANYASLRGPVGMNRVFIAIVGETTSEKLHSGLKQGRTFVTNGPLLGLEIDGKHPGDDITLTEPRTLPYHVSLRSIVPIDHFELIFNGRVIASHRLKGARTQADVTGNIEIPASGWLVLRAWNDHADPEGTGYSLPSPPARSQTGSLLLISRYYANSCVTMMLKRRYF